MPHRFLRAFVPAFALALPAAAAAASQPGCTVTPSGFGAAQLACTLEADTRPRTYRFEATFEGVHDDSSALVSAMLDGVRQDCVAPSRPRLQGESDGDAISCQLDVPAAAAPRTLRLFLEWHHATPAAMRWR